MCVKIAVVNTGISRSLAQSLNVIGGLSYLTNFEDKCVELLGNIYDEIGTGTKILNIINRYVEDSNYYIIKIFDENNRTNTMSLEMALDYLAELDVDIINLSISFDNMDMNKIVPLCEKLRDKGKILIIPYENNIYEISKLNNVITVKGDIFDNEESYEFIEDNNELFMKTSIIPVLSYNHKDEPCFYGGLGKATSIVTGIIANIINNNPNIDYNEIKRKLRVNSKAPIKNNYLYSNGKYTKFEEYLDFNTNFHALQILNGFCDYLDVSGDFLLTHRLKDTKKDVNEVDIINLINIIENIENVKVNLKEFSIKDSEWIYSLLNYAELNTCM